MKHSPYYRCHVFECSGRGIAGIHPLPADELLGFNQQERAELLSDIEGIEKNWDWSKPHKKSCFTETRITLYKLAKDDSKIEQPTEGNSKQDDFYTGQESLNNGFGEDLDTKYAPQSAKSNNPAPHTKMTSPSSYDFIEDAYIENLKQAAELYKASADSIEKKLGFVHTLWQEPGTPDPEPHHTLENSQEAPTGSVIPGLFKLVFPYLSKRNPGPSDTSRPLTPPLEGDSVAFDTARKHFLKYDPARVPLLAVQWKFKPAELGDTENFIEMASGEVLDSALIVSNGSERSTPYLENTSQSAADEQSTPGLGSTSESGDISISHQGAVSSERSISDALPSTSYEISRSLGSDTTRLSPIVEKDESISPDENVSIESLGLGRLFNDKDMSNGDFVQNQSNVESGSTTSPECDASGTQGATLGTAGPIDLADGHGSFPISRESIEDILSGASIDINSKTDRKKFHAEATRQMNFIYATMSRMEPFYPREKNRSEIVDDKHSSSSSEKRDANQPSLEVENPGLAMPEGVFRSNATNTNPDININKPTQANENPSQDINRTKTDSQNQNKSSDATGTLQISNISATEYIIIVDSPGFTALGSGMIDSATLTLSNKNSTQPIKILLKPERPSRFAKGISTLFKIRSSFVHLLNLYFYITFWDRKLGIPADRYLIISYTHEVAKYLLYCLELLFNLRSTVRSCPEHSTARIIPRALFTLFFLSFLCTLVVACFLAFLSFLAFCLSPKAHQYTCLNCMNMPPALVFTYNNAICPANYSASPNVPVARVFGLNTTSWLPTATCGAMFEDQVETTALGLATVFDLVVNARIGDLQWKHQDGEDVRTMWYMLLLANEVFQALVMN